MTYSSRGRKPAAANYLLVDLLVLEHITTGPSIVLKFCSDNVQSGCTM